MKKHLENCVVLATFRSVYYTPSQLIMSVENACCQGGGQRGKKWFLESPFSLLCCTSTNTQDHSNAFTWKINENVWHFHLMWKPHEPQFNCSILCGSEFFLFKWREEKKQENRFPFKSRHNQAMFTVYRFFFSQCISTSSDERVLRQSNIACIIALLF